MKTSLRLSAIGLFGLASAMVVAPLLAQEDPMKVDRHITIDGAANLTASDATAVYEDILADMVAGYSLSDDPSAAAYPDWARLNVAPYRSATHGNRFVNNYANPVAARVYARSLNGEAMPTGSVLVKDSFTVTNEGEVFVGALFIMEKLAAGKRPAYGDWRYIMILPDGSLFGDSEGSDAPRMGFCDGCHAAVARNDRLFFLPRAFESSQ